MARETKRMVQIGSQHRSTPFKMQAMKAVQDGVIGKVYLAKGLCFKRRASIGHEPDSPTPAGVNWDLFLGPAPMRPFNKLRFKYNWHWFWDTGNGDIGNQGVHEMGICRWGLGDPDMAQDSLRARRQVRLHRRSGNAQYAAGKLRLRRARDRLRSARPADRRRRCSRSGAAAVLRPKARSRRPIPRRLRLPRPRTRLP